MARLGLAAFAAAAWLIPLPTAAANQLDANNGRTLVAFVGAALLTALAWWLHLRQRSAMIGALASAIAYGVVLLVTQRSAEHPRFDLFAGLLLFATGIVSALIVITTGIERSDAWWITAHWLLAIGLRAATFVSALPVSDLATSP